MTEHSTRTFRGRLAALAEDSRFQRAIIVLIVVNAITLGLETSPSIMASVGPALVVLDHVVLAIFVAELAIRIGAYGRSFFRDPWSIFDFVVVGLALAPSTENFSVLRALRVLRVLRLVTAVPQMRRVVGGLLSAEPTRVSRRLPAAEAGEPEPVEGFNGPFGRARVVSSPVRGDWQTGRSLPDSRALPCS